MIRWWLRLLGLVALAAALSVSCERTRPAEFPHAPHLTQTDCGQPGQPRCLSCKSCHANLEDPKAEPATVAICSDCHEAGQRTKLRAASDRGPRDGRGTAIRFSHEQHLKLSAVRGQCVSCHAGIASPAGDATGFPPMATCLGCHVHQKQFDQAECTPCHAQGDLERMLPETFMVHDQSWVRQHGAEAATSGALCNQCHSQEDCTSCHVEQSLAIERRIPDRITPELVHRGDFLTRHAIEAMSQPTTCLRCHSPSSCDSCHVERGVSGARLGAINPHPPGWVGGNPASRDFHGRAARRDILSCASCHDQGPATNCIRCHKVGGPGGNPHPSGWRSARSPDAAMCRYCHGS